MRDEHGGGAGRDERGAQVDGEALAQGAVEGGQGLVEQQEPRRAGRARGPGRRAGARRRTGSRLPRSLVPGQADELEQRRDATAATGRQAVGDVPADGPVREQLPVLEHQPEPAPVHGHAGERGRRPRTTVPPASGSRPATARSSDDLPHPDGPSSATTVAGRDVAARRRRPPCAGPYRTTTSSQGQTVHHSPPAPGARSRSQAATIPAVSTARTTDAASAMP